MGLMTLITAWCPRAMLSSLSRPVDCVGFPRTRFVRPAKESNAAAHVKRALTRSDGNVEKDTVTLCLVGAEGTEERVLALWSLACGASLARRQLW